jgi:hypothetical protein
MDKLAAILAAPDLVAVLARGIRVQLLEISGSGCLLASASPIHAGTTGTLKLVVGDVEYDDDIRVSRCTVHGGSSAPYRVAAEFLWTRRPYERSIRRLIARVPLAAVTEVRLEGEQRM